MRHRHELGQCWAAKQCMVRTTDVHHLELDGLAVAILLLPKENLQLHPAHRGARMPRHDAMEGEPARFQLSKWDAQLLHEHAGEPACVCIRAYDGV
jgi:hypothetical protein